MEGAIKYVDLEKRFGFIEANGQDYFFHCYNLDNKRDEPHLKKGMLVQFVESMGKRGPRADEVKLLGESRIAHDPLSEPFRTFKSKPTTRVDTHETSTWVISSRHYYQKEARELIIERAHSLGANAISHFKCERIKRRGRTEYILSGIPTKVSQRDVKLKKASHSIDRLAFRVKRNSYIRFIICLACLSFAAYVGHHHVGNASLSILALLPIFWNDRSWLKRRKARRPARSATR